MHFARLLSPSARLGLTAGSAALVLALACSSSDPPSTGDPAVSGKGGGTGQAGNPTGGAAGTAQAGASGSSAGSTAGSAPLGGGAGTGTGGTSAGTSGSGPLGGTAGSTSGSGGSAAGAASAAGDGSSSGGAGTNAGGSDTAGGGGSGASAGTGSGPCGAPGLLFCEDFESTEVGMLPAGGAWQASNCFDTQRTLEVDDSQHRSGGRSLVSGKIGYDDCSLHADIGMPDDFYVRSFVLFGAGADFSMHEVTVFELAPSASTDDPEIRIGFRGDSSCNPTGSEVTITGGGEVTGCSGFQFEAGTWYCVEAHVVQSGSGATVELFIDDAAQSFTVHSMPVATLEWPSWTTPARYLKVGVRSYSGQPEWLVYNDDVAVGSQRIGCN